MGIPEQSGQGQAPSRIHGTPGERWYWYLPGVAIVAHRDADGSAGVEISVDAGTTPVNALVLAGVLRNAHAKTHDIPVVNIVPKGSLKPSIPDIPEPEKEN